uniref:Eukaryotic translation initiation factor 4C n=1 Tax=Astatotilapia calliptera TaxID=8154 RepID=A0AAX7SEP7_ASTCA
MPKNKGKGGKNRRRGKNENESEKRELVFKEDGQEYAQVIKMLGNGRLEAMCFDGTKRLCHIRGKLRKKVGMTRAPSVAFSHHHTQRKLCGVTPRQHFLRQPPSACVRVTKCSVTLCHSSLLCFVFLQVWINTSDIILVGLRDYQDNKADVILKYNADEARSLKAYGELPEHAKINETDTFGPGDDDEIQFDDIADDDEDIDDI